MGKGGGSCGSKSDDALPDQHHKVSIVSPQPTNLNKPNKQTNNQSINQTFPAPVESNENQQYLVNESPQSTQALDQSINQSQTARASQIELRNAGSIITNEPFMSINQSINQTNHLSPTAQYQTISSPSAVNSQQINQSVNQSFSQLPNQTSSHQASTFITYLKKVPLLNKLTDSDYVKLAESLVEERFSPGEYVVRQGDDGSTFYLIREGEARVTINQPSNEPDNQSTSQVELAVLKQNDYFGEQALVHNSKRMASVQAINQLTVLSMNRDRFQQLFGSDKLTVNFVKRAAVSAETVRSDDQAASLASSQAINQQRMQKTDAQLKMLLGAVDRNILFDQLSVNQKRSVVDAMWLDDIANDSIIIKQGDPGSHFYVVESGVFDIYVTPKSTKRSISTNNPSMSQSNIPVMNQSPITPESKKVATRGVGESFGELALLYNAPRAATVVAIGDSSVWVLSRVDFRRIVERGNREKLAEYEAFLKKVTSFEALLDYERARIAEALEEITYPAGACIVRQNEPGDTFFIVKHGEVLCTLATDDGEEEVARYGPGDYFGERALIAGDVRAATCTAIGPVTCLYLNREAFSALLGPMEDIFKRRVEGYSTPRNASPSISSTPTGSPAPVFARLATIKNQGASSHNLATPSSRQSVTLKSLTITPKFTLGDFKIIGTLGKGSFGHVQLVRHFSTGAVYALKTVSKCQVVKLGQQQHMMDERRAMMSLNSPHLIRLFGTFQDKNAIYMVLEPSLGGELFSVLRARTLFDEPTARFYAAAVVCAFDYMHSKGYIYRDLKPENLLLDSRGYLKITDFGFAKQVGDGRTWTLCGTPDYLAPEVVSGSGHGKGVDWWTLGILLYEMLASYPPFYDEDPMRTYAKIMRGEFSTPSHFTRPARDLIRRLLHPKPTKRLGVVAGGAKAVMDHAFFAGFDWNAFQQQTMRPPILPHIRGPEDLSNFDKYPPDNTKFEPYYPDPNQVDWTAEF